jgi:hypothetical protein
MRSRLPRPDRIAQEIQSVLGDMEDRDLLVTLENIGGLPFRRGLHGVGTLDQQEVPTRIDQVGACGHGLAQPPETMTRVNPSQVRHGRAQAVQVEGPETRGVGKGSGRAGGQVSLRGHVVSQPGSQGLPPARLSTVLGHGTPRPSRGETRGPTKRLEAGRQEKKAPRHRSNDQPLRRTASWESRDAGGQKHQDREKIAAAGHPVAAAPDHQAGPKSRRQKDRKEPLPTRADPQHHRQERPPLEGDPTKVAQARVETGGRGYAFDERRSRERHSVIREPCHHHDGGAQSGADQGRAAGAADTSPERCRSGQEQESLRPERRHESPRGRRRSTGIPDHARPEGPKRAGEYRRLETRRGVERRRRQRGPDDRRPGGAPAARHRVP